MNSKLIILIVSTTILLSFFMVGISINNQKETLMIINEIRSVIIKENINNFSENHKDLIAEYVINQNNFRDMWWHTIINQSGLSIIFTLIILLITLTVGYITKLQFNENFEKRLNEFFQNTKDIFNDIIIIFDFHKGEVGAQFSSSEGLLKKYIIRINGFSSLKILSRNDFKKIYEEDLKQFSTIIINYSNCQKDTNDSEFKTESIEYFKQIENLTDKENIFLIIEKQLNNILITKTNKEDIDRKKISFQKFIVHLKAHL